MSEKRKRGPNRGDPREVARRVVRRALREDAYATLALSGEIDRAGLDRRDAALATELSMTTLRHLGRIDRALEACADRGLGRTSAKVMAVLRVAGCEILFLRSIPARAAINEAASAARRVGGPKVAGFANALLRRLAERGEPPLPSEPRARIAAASSLPDWIVALLAERLGDGDELGEAAAALSAVPALGLRANRMRASREELSARLAAEAPEAEIAPHPLATSALVARRLGPPERLASFREGLFSIQDPAAQAAGALLEPNGARAILDGAAGVGGKSCHLAELTGDAVPIDAAEIDGRKLEKLEASAARLGLSSIRPVEVDLADAGDRLAQQYDRVFLDAPCSGLGVLRRHPEAKWRLEPDAVGRMAALQRRLLEAVLPRLAPGGALVYAVCTFTAAEGPDQIAALRQRHPDLELEASFSSWPHRDDADAFFAARLRRGRLAP